VTAATPVEDANGPHCRVTGAILPVDPAAPRILFQADLPKCWNGRALQSGGGCAAVLITAVIGGLLVRVGWLTPSAGEALVRLPCVATAATAAAPGGAGGGRGTCGPSSLGVLPVSHGQIARRVGQVVVELSRAKPIPNMGAAVTSSAIARDRPSPWGIIAKATIPLQACQV
jgi:hypothetical protein